MKLADRLRYFQGNVFDAMDRAKAAVAATGQPIVDLSLGSADLPVADHILAAIEASVRDASTYGYQLFASTAAFRQAVATWFERRFGLRVDPEREVLTLIGSQEGTAHLPLAVMNPQEYALVLDPGYPSHAGGVSCGGTTVSLALAGRKSLFAGFRGHSVAGARAGQTSHSQLSPQSHHGGCALGLFQDSS